MHHEGFGVVVEHSTSVCYAVGAKVMSSIPHVAETSFWADLCSHIQHEQCGRRRSSISCQLLNNLLF